MPGNWPGIGKLLLLFADEKQETQKIGLFPLTEDDASRTIDVVAVHGIQGDATACNIMILGAYGSGTFFLPQSRLCKS